MTPRALARLGGVAVATGAGVAIAAQLLYRIAGSPGTMAQLVSPFWNPAQAFQLVGVLLVLIGLPAVYACQAERLGAFGLISFALLFIGLITEIVGPASGLWMAELAARPETRPLVEAHVMPVALGLILFGGLITLWIGAIAFGASVIRARVFARPAGILLIVAIILDLVGGFVFRTSLFGPELAFVALAWLGAQLIVGLSNPERTSHSNGVAATV